VLISYAQPASLLGLCAETVVVLTSFTEDPPRSRPSNRVWLLAAAFSDATGTGVVVSVSTVLIAAQHGVVAAGVAVAASSLSRAASVVTARALQDRTRSARSVAATFRAVVWVMTLASLVAVSSSAKGPLWLTVCGLALFSLCNNLSTGYVNHEGGDDLVRLGPAGICGQATGAMYGAGVLLVASSLPSWGSAAAVGAGLLVQLLQLPLMRRVGFSLAPKPDPWGTLLRPLTRGFSLAALTYGPLGIYAVLVVETASLAWVGPSMIAYAAGALAAQMLDRRLGVGRQFPMLYLVAAAGVFTWSFAFSGPLVLVGRFLSGALLFTAQGRFLRSVASTGGGPTPLVAATVGLGLGAGAGSYVAGILATGLSVPSMGVVFGAVTAVLAVLAQLCRGLQRTCPEPSVKVP
jgi:hypothetical protein